MCQITTHVHIALFSYFCYNNEIYFLIPSFMLKVDFQLKADKEAVVASTATFVLTTMFFVMAFMLFPAL